MNTPDLEELERLLAERFLSDFNDDRPYQIDRETLQSLIAKAREADELRSAYAALTQTLINCERREKELRAALTAIQSKMADFIHLANNVGINDADGFYLGHAVEVEAQARAALGEAK